MTELEDQFNHIVGMIERNGLILNIIQKDVIKNGLTICHLQGKIEARLEEKEFREKILTNKK